MTIINSLKNAGFGRSSLFASSGQIWQVVSAKKKMEKSLKQFALSFKMKLLAFSFLRDGFALK